MSAEILTRLDSIEKAIKDRRFSWFIPWLAGYLFTDSLCQGWLTGTNGTWWEGVIGATITCLLWPSLLGHKVAEWMG